MAQTPGPSAWIRLPDAPAPGAPVPLAPPPAGPSGQPPLGHPGPPAAAPIAPEAPAQGARRTVWTVILILDLVLLGLIFGAQAVLGIWATVAPHSRAAELVSQSATHLDTTTLVVSTVVPFILIGVVPALWVLGTRQRPWEGFVRYLGLGRFGPGVGWGAVLFMACFAAEFVVGLAYMAALATVKHESLAQVEDESASQLTQGILGAINPVLILAIPLMAALGEELLFRGILQKWIGVWGQAIVFGIFHAGYASVMQLVVPFGLGLAFGFVYKRTRNLWITITAHFLVDFVALGLGYALAH